MSQRLNLIRDKMGIHGRAGDNFPFMGLCIVAGLIAAIFFTIVLVDAYRSWRRNAPLREAMRRNRQRQANLPPANRPGV